VFLSQPKCEGWSLKSKDVPQADEPAGPTSVDLKEARGWRLYHAEFRFYVCTIVQT